MSSNNEKCIKKSFSKQSAHRALSLIQKKGKRMRAYECHRCFRYHLTSETEKTGVFFRKASNRRRFKERSFRRRSSTSSYLY